MAWRRTFLVLDWLCLSPENGLSASESFQPDLVGAGQCEGASMVIDGTPPESC
jgi:hypothetical protein